MCVCVAVDTDADEQRQTIKPIHSFISDPIIMLKMLVFASVAGKWP